MGAVCALGAACRALGSEMTEIVSSSPGSVSTATADTSLLLAIYLCSYIGDMLEQLSTKYKVGRVGTRKAADRSCLESRKLIVK